MSKITDMIARNAAHGVMQMPGVFPVGASSPIAASTDDLLRKAPNGQVIPSMKGRKEAARQAMNNIKRPPPLTPSKTVNRAIKLLTKSYYAPMRLLGYLGSAIDKKMEGWIENSAKNHFGQEDFTKEQSKRWVGFIEAAFFGGLSIIYYFKEKSDLVKSLLPAVAAEKSKHPSSVRKLDLNQSANPIIQAGLRRLRRSYLTRGISDAFFIKSVSAGVVAQAFRITAERTIFSERNAYERLVEIFENVQDYHFDIHSISKVGRNLANVVQQAQHDHDREPWDREVITQFFEFFEDMAEEIVEKRMAMAEVTYLLGELMVRRYTPQEAMDALNEVKEKGLTGVTKQSASTKNSAVSTVVFEREVTAKTEENKVWSNGAGNQSAGEEMLADGPREFGMRTAVEEAASNIR